MLVKTIWSYTYKGISRCNAILDNMYKAKDTMSEEDYRMLEGCARFYRACFYSRICQLFGDPVFFLDDITLMEMTGNQLRGVPGIADVNDAYVVEIAEGFITVRNVVSAITIILIVILLVRPSGILGKKRREKV